MLGEAEGNPGRLRQAERVGEEKKVEQRALKMPAVCFKVNQINKINTEVS